MNRIWIKLLMTLAVAALPMASFAEHVVIVNPNNSNAISNSDVKNLFLAKTKTFADGTLAIPLNQEEGMDIRVDFDQEMAGKTTSQMKAYWAKLVFTGKAVPIKELSSDAEVIELVAKNPSTIGYVKKSSVTDAVKVVTEF